MDSNINYKEMYLKMVRASEKAIQIIMKAQQECGEMYLSSQDLAPDIELTPPK